MRNDLARRHLDAGELVQFLDHELPRRRYAQAREHVRTCWTCHARIDELQSLTAEIVRLDEKLAASDATLPGSGDGSVWPDLGPRLRDARRELEANAPRGWAAVPFWARLALASAALASLGLAYTLLGRWSRPAVPVAAPPSSPVRPAVPARRETTAAIPPAIPAAPPVAMRTSPALGLELRVIQVLHRVGADTGEPVEAIATTDGSVHVIAKGLAPAREAEIREALAALPEVAVRFEQPSAPGPRPADSGPATTFTTRRAPFAAALEAAAGGASEVESLTNDLLDASENMMAAAHALHHLAQRFPADRRQGMNAVELTALSEIEADHTATLRAQFQKTQELLAPLRRSLGDGDGSAPEAAGAGLFESARRVERALHAIFGGADPPRPLPALLSELARATRQLDRTLEAAR